MQLIKNIIKVIAASFKSNQIEIYCMFIFTEVI
jgi:hypothetical protein